MTYAHLLILALIQGITEFLPISSSGHLILLPELASLADQGQALDVAVHLGTLGAVILYFWRDVAEAMAGVPRLVRGKMDTPGARLAYLLMIATVPSIVVGFFLKETGLIDMMQQSDDPDLTCNAILRILWDVSSDGFSANGRDPLALRRARTELRGLFAYLVQNTLGPVMPDAWGRGWTEDRILRAVAEAFKAEIASGRFVAIGLDGAHIKDAA